MNYFHGFLRMVFKVEKRGGGSKRVDFSTFFKCVKCVTLRPNVQHFFFSEYLPKAPVMITCHRGSGEFKPILKMSFFTDKE